MTNLEILEFEFVFWGFRATFCFCNMEQAKAPALKAPKLSNLPWVFLITISCVHEILAW